MLGNCLTISQQNRTVCSLLPSTVYLRATKTSKEREKMIHLGHQMHQRKRISKVGGG